MQHKAQFYGGPYDGLELTLLQINRKCLPLSLAVGGRARFFLLLPPPDRWDQAEARTLRGAGKLYPYERRLGEAGAAFHYAPGPEFDEAVRQAEAG
jgi:hypothetical protein